MPSTVILEYNYDALSETLQIKFTTGTVYVYKNVPQEVYNLMKASDAKGVFLNRNIKGRFQYEKIIE